MQAQNERTFLVFSQTLSQTAHGLEIKVSIFSPLENVAEAKPLLSCSYRHKSTIHAHDATTYNDTKIAARYYTPQTPSGDVVDHAKNSTKLKPQKNFRHGFPNRP
jgi:hypothetical protein